MTYQEAVDLVSSYLHLSNQRIEYRNDTFVIKTLKVVPTSSNYTAFVFLSYAEGDKRGTMVSEKLESFLKKYKKTKRPQK